MSPRVVIVTGAASGIGHATARRFLEAGETVVALDVADTVPDGTDFVRCDLGSVDAVRSAVDHAVTAHGRIDVVANVAGVVQFGRFETVTEEEWDRVHSIDLKGPFFLMQAALPHLRESKGCIVNVSSVAGRVPQPYTPAYAAAKGGLTQLTTCLALELAPDGVRVNAVAPGTVNTPLVAQVAEKFPDDLNARVADRLMMMLPQGSMEPEEVAAAIFYLASADARSVTGTVLAIDGFMS